MKFKLKYDNVSNSPIQYGVMNAGLASSSHNPTFTDAGASFKGGAAAGADLAASGEGNCYSKGLLGAELAKCLNDTNAKTDPCEGKEGQAAIDCRQQNADNALDEEILNMNNKRDAEADAEAALFDEQNEAAVFGSFNTAPEEEIEIEDIEVDEFEDIDL